MEAVEKVSAAFFILTAIITMDRNSCNALYFRLSDISRHKSTTIYYVYVFLPI